MDEKIEQQKKKGEIHVALGRRSSLVDKAKDALQEVAEKTMELAHEIKEEVTGHVSDKDLIHAAKKVSDLHLQLADEQHKLKNLHQEAEAADNSQTRTLHKYLKKKEQKAKEQVQDTVREIAEAESEYTYLERILAPGKV